jgi:hypothetical protein
MLEIIVLVLFAKKLSAIAQEKGRPSAWAALGVAGWILGEILGAIIGAIIGDGDQVSMYMFALLGAAIGAGIAFVIVNNLSPVEGSLDDGTMGDDHSYSHADPNNIYSPPGHGRREP